MPYLIGVVLGIVVVALMTITGFERDRAAWPVVVIVVATYYVLFAVMAGDRKALIEETGVALVFTVIAILGFKRSAWWVVAGLLGHGVFDFVRGHMIVNPGVPSYWPAFCGSIDVAMSAWVAWRVSRRGASAPSS